MSALDSAVAQANARIRNKLVAGWDYRTNTPLTLTRAEWRAQFDAVIADGGSRRVLKGDPTGFNARGVMLFEMHEG